MTSPWFRIKEAAEYAKVSPRTIENWMKEGLRFSKVGRIIFIKSEWIDEFIESFALREDPERIAREILEDLRKK